MNRVQLGLKILSVMACLVLAGGSASCGGVGGDLPTGRLDFQTEARTTSLEVEIATTEEARAAGLMHRTSLGQDAGMVFLFDEPSSGAFWMKNTLIPLSIAFWGPDGRIVAILDMEPCRADPCPVYSPGESYVGAVEANQGWFADRGVEVGDTVRLMEP